MTPVNKELDISGLHSPLDMLRTKKAMNAIAPYEILKVVYRKPVIDGNTLPTEYDLITFCNMSNYTIIDREISHKMLVLHIQKTSKISQFINPYPYIENKNE